ncbi:MFS transporter [Rhizosaccharibacter radicis]|uniref:MFS transporter n=1 Tax=Rhizosaccharibacter radicis TaxID=2782605 RepID=A0ABT1W2P9_9PROT|nr:MFS transporter [Acetobacteraceae bacterium KSS12]
MTALDDAGENTGRGGVAAPSTLSAGGSPPDVAPDGMVRGEASAPGPEPGGAPADTGAGVVPPVWLIRFIALSCGLVVANLYYAQPLIVPIARSLGIRPELSGLVVTLTQFGYGGGLLLLVSLADAIENRRLILGALAMLVLALAGSALATNAATFLFCALLTGFCAAATQILVPLATHLTPERLRGRTVGTVMAGLLGGIMLSRPVASGLADHLGWHSVFAGSAVATLLLALMLRPLLPHRRPAHADDGPWRAFRSLPGLVRDTPLMRHRASLQVTAFAAFSLFWTAVPILLAGPRFGMSQSGIALFALAGAGGALAAPLAGRLADRGHTEGGTVGALLAILLPMLVTIVAASVGSLPLLVLAAVVLDAGVQFNQVLNLRSIYMLQPEARGRLNALFMSFVFLGGGIASALAPVLLHRGGWAAVAIAGSLAVAVALVLQWRRMRRAAG